MISVGSYCWNTSFAINGQVRRPLTAFLRSIHQIDMNSVWMFRDLIGYYSMCVNSGADKHKPSEILCRPITSRRIASNVNANDLEHYAWVSKEGNCWCPASNWKRRRVMPWDCTEKNILAYQRLHKTEISSFWRNCRHRLCLKLSKWYLSMKPATKLSKNGHIFIVDNLFCSPSTSCCHVCK